MVSNVATEEEQMGSDKPLRKQIWFWENYPGLFKVLGFSDSGSVHAACRDRRYPPMMKQTGNGLRYSCCVPKQDAVLWV